MSEQQQHLCLADVTAWAVITQRPAPRLHIVGDMVRRPAVYLDAADAASVASKLPVEVDARVVCVRIRAERNSMPATLGQVGHTELCRDLSSIFARVFRAYLECDDEVQQIVREMCTIANSPEADGQEREMALETIADALFPQYDLHKHGGARWQVSPPTSSASTRGRENRPPLAGRR